MSRQKLYDKMAKWYDKHVDIDVVLDTTETKIGSSDNQTMRKRATMLSYIGQYFETDYLQPKAFSIPLLFKDFGDLIHIEGVERLLNAYKYDKKLFEAFMLGETKANNAICSSTPLEGVFYDVYKITKVHCVMLNYAEFVNPVIQPENKQYRLRKLISKAKKEEYRLKGWVEVQRDVFMFPFASENQIKKYEYAITPDGYLKGKIRYIAGTPVCYTHRVIEEALKAFANNPKAFKTLLLKFSSHGDTITNDEDFLT